jgi:hypothetical protein
VARVGGSAPGNLPTSDPLPANASTLLDNAPPPRLSCYAVLPLGGVTGAPLGTSDLLCSAPNVRSGIGAPQNLTLRFNQSNVAGLSWTAPANGTFDGYLLVPFGGTPIPIPLNTMTAAFTMSGPTCFALITTQAGAAVGYSDIVCGFPGVATV